MRNLTKLLLTAGLAVAFVSFTLAQQGRGGGFGGMRGISEATVLMSKEIQSELKLTDEQKAKLSQLTEKISALRKDAFQGGNFKKGGGGETFLKLQEDTNKATEAFVKAELKPDQAKRFKQLALQAMSQFGGPAVFMREDVQTALKFTDKQKELAKTTVDDTRKDAQELFQASGKDKDKMTEAIDKVAKLNKEASDKIVASFTPDQKKAWEDMLGPKVEMKREWFTAGGMGGGGNFRKKKNQE